MAGQLYYSPDGVEVIEVEGLWWSSDGKAVQPVALSSDGNDVLGFPSIDVGVFAEMGFADPPPADWSLHVTSYGAEYVGTLGDGTSVAEYRVAGRSAEQGQWAQRSFLMGEGVAEVWMRVLACVPRLDAGCDLRHLVVFQDSQGQAIGAVATDGVDWRVDRWSGGSVVDSASGAAFAASESLERFDLHWRASDGANRGMLGLYIAGSLVAALTHDETATVERVGCGAYVDRVDATDDGGEALTRIYQAGAYARDPNNYAGEVIQLGTTDTGTIDFGGTRSLPDEETDTSAGDTTGPTTELSKLSYSEGGLDTTGSLSWSIETSPSDVTAELWRRTDGGADILRRIETTQAAGTTRWYQLVADLPGDASEIWTLLEWRYAARASAATVAQMVRLFDRTDGTVIANFEVDVDTIKVKAGGASDGAVTLGAGAGTLGEEGMTELYTWTSEPGAQDWSGYTIDVGPFASHQMPWAMWDAAAGEQMVSTISEGVASGLPQMRTLTDLSKGSGMVKGAPAIWLGKHNNVVSPVNPFVTGGNPGYWSDGSSEVRVSTGTRDFKDHSDPGITFWHAIQLYAYRTQFLGDNYTDAGTDGIDIQLRFRSNNFSIFQSELNQQIGTFTSAGITWNIGLKPDYNGRGTWMMLCWPDGENYVDEIVDFDVLGLINQCRTLFNADQGTGDARWWVWGVQVWMEPRSGSIDTATHGFEVTVDGVTYGALERPGAGADTWLRHWVQMTDSAVRLYEHGSANPLAEVTGLSLAVAGEELQIGPTTDGAATVYLAEARVFDDDARSEVTPRSVEWPDHAPYQNVATSGTPRDENLTEFYTWASERGAQDWSGYPINVGPFASHQLPWGMWDAAAGEPMVSTISAGDVSGWPRLRTMAELSMGSGMVKGAPAIWLGKHNNVTSAINPFVTGGQDGYWSDGPSEVRVSTGTQDFKDHSDPGITFWNAIQLYAFRTQYLGDDYTGAGTDGIDIQLRFRSNNMYLFKSDKDSKVGQFTSARITWNIGLKANYNGKGTWIMLCWPADELYVDEIVDFDVLGFVNQCRTLFNVQQGSHDGRWWLWGVQVWMEPRSGVIDTATAGFEVTVDGMVYGTFDRATTSGGGSNNAHY
ncbi:MAG: hypothetical protein GVY33_08460 [Alphaproteobacteria bacterium]|jgi:hypothetical protein|nr:hypothetical protein [Alphaproteobacteria bacterium]